MTERSTSDGLSASYYELPSGATELYHLIIHRNMNAQLGEIFRAAYRYGQASHSDPLRDINKIIAYAKQEKERLLNEQKTSIDFEGMRTECDKQIEELTKAMQDYLASC